MPSPMDQGTKIIWQLVTSHALSVIIGGIVALVGWSFYAGSQYATIMAKLTENQAKVMDVQLRMSLSETDRATMHVDLATIKESLIHNSQDHADMKTWQHDTTKTLEQMLGRLPLRTTDDARPALSPTTINP